MPYKIEIIGNNIQELFQESMNLAIVMGQGGNNAFRAPAAAPVAEPVGQSVDPSRQGTTVGERVEGAPNEPNIEVGPNPEVAPLPAAPKPRGRPPKVQVVEAVATDMQSALEADGAKLAAMTGEDHGPIFPDEPKEYTLKDDVQPRLSAIDDAYKARNNKAGIDAKQLQAQSVNYMVQLLSKFGAKSTRDLKPDQFAGFMAESVAYLDGTAPEVA